MKTILHACLAAALTGLAAMAVPAEAAYPDRPVTIIVPVGAGGGTDQSTRVLAEALKAKWGQPVLIDNRPGASSIVGAEACAKAKPDGYTFCVLSPDALVYNQFLYKSLPYDAAKLVPVAETYRAVRGVFVGQKAGFDSIAGLIKAAKEKPGQVSFASPSSVTLTSFIQTFDLDNGTRIKVVNYRSGSEITAALLRGEVDMTYLGIGDLRGQVQDGSLKLIAVHDDKRSPLYPDVPTLAEAGYKTEPALSWQALYAPAGTPDDVISKVAADVKAVVSDPAYLKEHIDGRGYTYLMFGPKELSALVEKQVAYIKELFPKLGVTPK